MNEIKQHTTALSILTALLGAAALAGCPSGDPDEGSTDTEPGPLPELPGVRLDCCYELSGPGGTPIEIGCTYPDINSPCIDPDNPDYDTNGNGSLGPAELQDLCARKCPDIIGPTGFSAGPFHVPGNLNVGISLDSPFYTCIATGGTLNMMEPTCDPSHESHLAEWETNVPPSHEGSLTSGSSGNQGDVAVNGNKVAVSYDGSYAFSISDCVPARQQEVCYLTMHQLKFELVGNPVFGGYEVDGAQLGLAHHQTTTATFNCDSSSCFGTFDFSQRTGTELSMNLSWDQTTTSTGTMGGGSILLSNGRQALGGVKRVLGELDLDASKVAGTLRLHGSGSDNLNGDFASATFEVTGPVTRYAP